MFDVPSPFLYILARSRKCRRVGGLAGKLRQVICIKINMVKRHEDELGLVLSSPGNIVSFVA